MLNDIHLLIVLSAFAVSFCFEYLSFKLASSNQIKLFGYNAIFLNIFASSAIFVVYPNILSFLILIISFYKSFNLARLFLGRMHATHLIQVTIRTAKFLNLLQASALVICIIQIYVFDITGDYLLMIWLGLSLTWGLISLKQAVIWYSRSTPRLSKVSIHDLPTVSLLIPARNETKDLEQSIICALSSTYPKLEILVLDDCSQDKTPELIKNYAHKGVRFIKGDMPKNNWLAKNQAYEKLADEATGEILLFTGVDTRLDPDSIIDCVEYMKSNSVEMLSIMPLRPSASVVEILFQPMRYWLEFVSSKVIDGRPPVLSTCWLIENSSFKALGKFKGLSRAILPEQYFAKSLAKQNHYAFLRSNSALKIITQKTLGDQYETALRTRYPLLKKRPESTAVVSFLSLIFILGPFILLSIGWIFLPGAVLIALTIVCILLASSHILISKASNTTKWWLSVFNFPLLIAIEICLLNISMYRYEFGTINWKGRNICLPVMHLTPNLPKLEP